MPIATWFSTAPRRTLVAKHYRHINQEHGLDQRRQHLLSLKTDVRAHGEPYSVPSLDRNTEAAFMALKSEMALKHESLLAAPAKVGMAEMPYDQSFSSEQVPGPRRGMRRSGLRRSFHNLKQQITTSLSGRRASVAQQGWGQEEDMLAGFDGKEDVMPITPTTPTTPKSPRWGEGFPAVVQRSPPPPVPPIPDMTKIYIPDIHTPVASPQTPKRKVPVPRPLPPTPTPPSTPPHPEHKPVRNHVPIRIDIPSREPERTTQSTGVKRTQIVPSRPYESPKRLRDALDMGESLATIFEPMMRDLDTRLRSVEPEALFEPQHKGCNRKPSCSSIKSAMGDKEMELFAVNRASLKAEKRQSLLLRGLLSPGITGSNQSNSARNSTATSMTVRLEGSPPPSPSQVRTVSPVPLLSPPSTPSPSKSPSLSQRPGRTPDIHIRTPRVKATCCEPSPVCKQRDSCLTSLSLTPDMGVKPPIPARETGFRTHRKGSAPSWL